MPRYEHAAFIPTSRPRSLWVFGGASETGNRNCVQVLDLGKKSSFVSFFWGKKDMLLVSFRLVLASGLVVICCLIARDFLKIFRR